MPSCAGVLIVSYFADRLKVRGPFIMGLLPVGIIGYGLLVATTDNRARYAGTFLIALCDYSSAPCILALIANNSAGHTKRASGISANLMIANLVSRCILVLHALRTPAAQPTLSLGPRVSHAGKSPELFADAKTLGKGGSDSRGLPGRELNMTMLNQQTRLAPSRRPTISPFLRLTLTSIPSLQAGFVATFAYVPSAAPRYVGPHAAVLGCLALGWVCITANVMWCAWENRARKTGKRDSNIIEYLKLVQEGKTRAPIGDRDPQFRFCL